MNVAIIPARGGSKRILKKHKRVSWVTNNFISNKRGNQN